MSEKLCPVCIELGFCQRQSAIQSLNTLGIQVPEREFPNLAQCPNAPYPQDKPQAHDRASTRNPRNPTRQDIIFIDHPLEAPEENLEPDNDSWDNRI